MHIKGTNFPFHHEPCKAFNFGWGFKFSNETRQKKRNYLDRARKSFKNELIDDKPKEFRC